MAVIDAFCFNGEWDMLEIRFNVLSPLVDKFIICESPETFSGLPKPLYWPIRDERFKKWENTVTHHVVRPRAFKTAFERAGYQKDSIRDALKDCAPDDIIYYGDVDEVWKPQKTEGKLRQLAYSYYLNNRSSEDWQGTNVFTYKNIRNLNDIRADHSIILEDGGWHFTNLMTHDELIHKIESYDHEEVNIPWVKDGLRARMDANIDFLGRLYDWKGNPFLMWTDEKDLPAYILDNKETWKKRGLWKS